MCTPITVTNTLYTHHFSSNIYFEKQQCSKASWIKIDTKLILSLKYKMYNKFHFPSKSVTWIASSYKELQTFILILSGPDINAFPGIVHVVCILRNKKMAEKVKNEFK